MKQLSITCTIILSIVTLTIYAGTQTDTIPVRKWSTDSLVGNTLTTKAEQNIMDSYTARALYTTQPSRFDTTPGLLLVVDSTQMVMTMRHAREGFQYLEVSDAKAVVQVEGYIIRKIVSLGELWSYDPNWPKDTDTLFYDPVGYLDKDKKPIVYESVWMSKEKGGKHGY